MKIRLLALISLALVLLLAGSALADLPNYNIFHIGLIDPAADFGSQGTDISTTLGNVTGRNLGNNNQAIFWTEEGGLVGLPNLASRPYAVGNGVNMFGTVVGTGATTFYGSSPLPLIWENGVVSQLPLPAGQDMGRANAINNLGVVAGSVNGGSLEAPAIYENGTATIITRATDTGCTGTTFYDINDAGLAVGPGTDPANAARNVGYVYDMATNTAFEVGALEGLNGALPFGVSPAGHVVGSSMLFQGAGTPFIWTAEDGMQAIPLPEGTSQGSAKGVNSQGWAVGTASSAFAIPFLYDGENTYQVADLLPPGTGWNLNENTSSSAQSISDEGIIVGSGEYNGVVSAYALVPDNVVPLMLQEFTAVGMDNGIAITWEVFLVDGSQSFGLQRADSMEGPWAPVDAPVSQLGNATQVLDTTAEAGQTYYYRLHTPSQSGDLLVMGYVSAQRIGLLGLALDAPWPNPAVGGTSLAYRLPSQQNIQITVHDLRGRLVKTLVDGGAADGEHIVQWDGRDSRGSRASAGVYFVNLKSPQGSLTQRVVLTR
jgi:uncharacterized membrane protein